ncbi:hypothetical protein QUG02_14020 [Bacillus hominis]|uniref:C1q domain-containing protein n=1 Tax=Bacillus hominis TaxID=2817478 RepID=A0ABT7RA61_9BACI|nr:hypothetical protein [Bacillus hominis]EJQ50578.1 hypothetical protein IEQ_02452 [Bacillus cereus BAG6X1-2]SCM95336.1 Uncharacterized protein BWINRASL_02744 [Bacillus mycoides]MDM5194084.1 hypothetical protein [Bacillus hominis]MDM5433789.1 hypothetical protein [Bacillus hominis]MDM5439211.1 hypothetical protein [Bacillus hominis]
MNLNSVRNFIPCAFPISESVLIPQSGFRAINRELEQKVGPADLTLISYPNEIFDLNNEYNPITSTFTPKQNGVYLIIASIGFFPNVPASYSARLFITINGEAVVADNDFLSEELEIVNILSVSTILKLSAGSNVQVIAQATTDGNTVPEPLGGTVDFMHFEAVRFPFPT